MLLNCLDHSSSVLMVVNLDYVTSKFIFQLPHLFGLVVWPSEHQQAVL
jgi:hypothetical protein